MSIDVTPFGFDDLARDLGRAADQAQPEMRKVVTKGALNIKQDWRRAATRSAGQHARHYPRSIDYDVTGTSTYVEAEVGPNDIHPQGGMGRGFEYGSINTAPKPDGAHAINREVPRFIKAADDVGARLLGDVG